MQLVIDIGNSNIVIALYDGEKWVNFFRYETKEDQPQIYYEKGLAELLLEWGISPQQIGSAVLSSVVPDINQKIQAAVETVIRKPCLLITPEVLSKLPMHIPHINDIGSDLVANAFAAIKLYEQPCIVIDFGTALTFTVVHPVRGIEGVTIAPGIKTAFSSLYYNTAQLPHVDLARPVSAIGKNTSHAMQAGIIIGYEGLVQHLVEKMRSELDEHYLVIGTGGLSESLKSITQQFDHINKLHTLEGVRWIGTFMEQL